MKLAMRLPEKARPAPDSDPREETTAEIIDLASRTAYPVVAQRKGKSDALGLAVGIGFVALLGAATLWGLNASRVEEPAVPAPAPAPPQAPAAPVAAPTPEQQAAIDAAVAPAPDPAPAPVLAAPPAVAPAPVGNPYASPTMVFDAGALPAPVLSVPVTPAPGTGEAGAATGSAADFASRVGG